MVMLIMIKIIILAQLFLMIVIFNLMEELVTMEKL